VLGLLVAVALGAVAVSRLATPERLTPWVEAQLAAALTGELALKRIEVELGGAVRAEGLVAREAPGAPAVLEVDAVEGRCAWLGLLAGTLRCSEIVVRGARVDARAPSGVEPGALALARALSPRHLGAPDAAPSALALHFAGRVEDLSVSSTVAGVGLWVRGATVAAAEVALVDGALTVAARGVDAPLQLDGARLGAGPPLTGHARLDARYVLTATTSAAHLAPLALRLDAGLELSSDARLDGLPPRAAPGTAPTVTVRARGALDLGGPLPRRFGPVDPLGGAARIDLAIRGAAPNLHVDLAARAPRVTWPPLALLELYAAIAVDGVEVTLEHASATIGVDDDDDGSGAPPRARPAQTFGEVLATGPLYPALALELSLVHAAPRAFVEATQSQTKAGAPGAALPPPGAWPELVDGAVRYAIAATATTPGPRASDRVGLDLVVADAPRAWPTSLAGALPFPLRVTGEVELPRAPGPGPTRGASPNRAARGALRVSGRGLAAEARGRLDPADPDVAWTVVLEGGALARLAAAGSTRAAALLAEPSPRLGLGGARLVARGRLARETSRPAATTIAPARAWTSTASLSLTGLVLGGAPPLTIAVDAALTLPDAGPEAGLEGAPATLRLARATATSALGRVELAGSLVAPRAPASWTGIRADALLVRAEVPALGPLARDLAALVRADEAETATAGAWRRLRGRASLRARVDGPLDAPDVDAALALERVGFGAIELAAPTPLVVRGRGGAWSIPRTPLALAVSVPASDDADDPTPRTVEVRAALAAAVDAAQLSAYLTLAPTPLSAVTEGTPLAPWITGGAASVALAIDGPRARPRVSAFGLVEGLAVRAIDVGRVQLSVDGALDALDAALRLDGPAGRLRARAGIVDGRCAALTLDVAALTLDPAWTEPLFGRAVGLVLTATAATAPNPSPLAADAWLPPLVGALRARVLSIDGEPAMLPELRVALSPTQEPGSPRVPSRQGLHLSLDGIAGLEADVRIGLAPPLALDATIALRRLDLAPLLPTPRPELSTALTGDGHVRLGPRGLEAALELDAAELAVGRTRLRLASPGTITIVDGETRLAPLVFVTPRSALTVRGLLGARAALDVEGTVPVEILPAFVPEIARADGIVGVALAIRGAPGALTPRGRVRVDAPITLRLRGTTRELVISGGTLEATPEAVVLEGLTGTLASGLFGASGRVRLDALRPTWVELALQAEAFPFRTADLDAEAQATLTLRGPPDGLRLAGHLEIVRARYRKKLRLDNFRLVAEADDGTASGAPLPPIELDVDVRSAGPVRVEVDAGSIAARLDLDVALRASGTLDAPRLEGRVSATSGRLEFPAAKLDVSAAVADFLPLEDPHEAIRLELAAEGEVETREAIDLRSRSARFVNVTLEGPPDALTLDLRSSGLDRLQTLALLITGRVGLQSLAAGDQALDSALAFAGSQLATPITAFLEEQLERQLNVDVRLGAEVSTRGFRVSAEKEFTRRVVVEGSYARTFDEAQATTATVRALLLLFDRAFFEASTTITRKATPLQPTEVPTTSRLELKYQLLGR
jgi:hypothetical protein